MRRFFRFLNRYMRPYWRDIVISLFLNLLAIAFSTVSLTMLIPFLQVLFGRSVPLSSPPSFSLSGQFLLDLFNYYVGQVVASEGPEVALLLICVASVLIFFFKNLFRYLALFVFARVRNLFLFTLRQRLYEHIVYLPIRYFTFRRRGDLITRLTTDVQEVEWAIVNSLEILFREPVTILMYLGLLVLISWELTLFVLVVLGLAGLVIGVIGRRLKQESLEAQHYTGMLASVAEETVRGLPVIKVFRAEQYMIRLFRRIHQLLYRVRVKALRRRELSSPLSEFLGICAVVLVLWVGGRAVLKGRGLPPETFITFVVVFSQLINPAKSFATAYYHVQRGMASAERIEEIFAEQTDRWGPISGTRVPPHPIKEIRYEHVFFRYHPDGEWVLQDVCVQLVPGSLIAIVGPSGSGKTTLVHLLPRFFDPVRGRILVNGYNLQGLDLARWRHQIAYVPQEPILFYDTIRNNILLGKPGATQQEVEWAARIAGAHEFIMRLPRGYDTHIGEAGARLSAGERQRIALARAFLKRAPILILDEATANLDVQTEEEVLRRMREAFPDTLILFVAHRLKVARWATHILVMDRGRVVEEGDHETLLRRGGLYALLVSKQEGEATGNRGVRTLARE